ncbi:MAG TPA: hypothetical protein VK968_17835 [Roseimicrobium sp.]|nr:hypothetical protein [Roseimicrobium sp.]
MTALFKLHKDLPPGVNPFPTLRGKQRFELLKTFNIALGGYILIHQLLVPSILFLLQEESQRAPLSLSFWYVYHALLAIGLSARFRSSRIAYALVYLAWFAVGYLPLTLGMTFFDHGVFRFKWKAISGLLCYGSSFLLTLALLYRLRMPTTAYLFKLESRIIPKWRYALPYALLGLTASLFWLFCPIGKKLSPDPHGTGVRQEEHDDHQREDAVKRRYQFD